MSSDQKLKEAEFFLELLDALDERKRPLTRVADTAQEASYLLSAILNAFYSAVVIMRDEEKIDVEEFVAANPEIYARADRGGERARTVHVSHTLPAFSGYLPPKLDAPLYMRKTPVLVEEAQIPGRMDVVFGPNHYIYVALKGRNIEVCEFCYDHFCKLRAFHASSRPQT